MIWKLKVMKKLFLLSKPNCKGTLKDISSFGFVPRDSTQQR